MIVKYRIRSRFVPELEAKSHENGYDECYFENDQLIYFLVCEMSGQIRDLGYYVQSDEDIKNAIALRNSQYPKLDLETIKETKLSKRGFILETKFQFDKGDSHYAWKTEEIYDEFKNEICERTEIFKDDCGSETRKSYWKSPSKMSYLPDYEFRFENDILVWATHYGAIPAYPGYKDINLEGKALYEYFKEFFDQNPFYLHARADFDED